MSRLRRLSCVFAACAFAIFTAGELHARGNWVTYENCTLIPNASNDGDSFHVRVKRKEYIFRLYYVDTPETDPTLVDRVSEQARYFGLTVPQTLQVAEVAKHYTAEKLSKPFTVRTCKEDALGRSRHERFYAFVETSEGDLAEKLVVNGLARIHGASGKPDGLLSINGVWAKLEQLQATARSEKVGAWGVGVGRMSARSEKEGGKAYSSFDQFFHKDEPVAAPSAVPGMKMHQPPAEEAAKLDVNSASPEQLASVPGIGPAMAARIVAARPMKTADDLRAVKGIGDATYAKIRPYFR